MTKCIHCIFYILLESPACFPSLTKLVYNGNTKPLHNPCQSLPLIKLCSRTERIVHCDPSINLILCLILNSNINLIGFVMQCYWTRTSPPTANALARIPLIQTRIVSAYQRIAILVYVRFIELYCIDRGIKRASHMTSRTGLSPRTENLKYRQRNTQLLAQYETPS